MNLVNKKIEKLSPHDDLAIHLKSLIEEYPVILGKYGLLDVFTSLHLEVAEAGSMANDQVQSLQQQAFTLLSDAEQIIQASFQEQQRAVEEFPTVNQNTEDEQLNYGGAVRTLQAARGAFDAWVEASEIISAKGENTVNVSKPIEDGQGNDIGVSRSGREDVAEELGSMLASTYSLYVKSLFYHWNVTGPQFHGLHALFEEHYQNLHEAGDDIAERIRSLGHFTPGSLQAFAKLSVVNDDEKLPDNADAMLASLQEAHELCANKARSVMAVADKVEDEVTADMMISRMQFHDQAIWMLSSSRS